MLVGDLRDAERVAFLARQYVERFGGSIYAGDFVHTLASTAIRFDLCATPADLAKFAALLALTPPEQGRAFLLAVARASVLLGRFEVAAQAAEAARKTAPAGSADEARAAALRPAGALSRHERRGVEAGVGGDRRSQAQRRRPRPSRRRVICAGAALRCAAAGELRGNVARNRSGGGALARSAAGRRSRCGRPFAAPPRRSAAVEALARERRAMSAMAIPAALAAPSRHARHSAGEHRSRMRFSALLSELSRPGADRRAAGGPG